MSVQGNSDVIDIALRVARAIEVSGGEYFVGGSVASSLQGEPRATNDIDFVLSLPLGRIRSFCEALGAEYLDAWAKRLNVDGLLARARIAS